MSHNYKEGFSCFLTKLWQYLKPRDWLRISTKDIEKQQQKGTNIRNLPNVRKKTGRKKNKSYISYYLIFATFSLVCELASTPK